MRGEELRAAIGAVPTVAGLDEAARVLWAEVAAGRIGEDEAEGLQNALGSRRKAIEGRAALRAAIARKAAHGANLWAWSRIEDRARSIGRRRPWQRSLPNLVTVVSAEWRAWLERGPRGGRGGGFGSSDPTERRGSRRAASQVSGPSQGLPGGRVAETWREMGMDSGGGTVAGPHSAAMASRSSGSAASSPLKAR